MKVNWAQEVFLSGNMLLFFGIASGVLSTFAYIPYIIDTVAGRTQPQRASWLIWSMLGSIALVSQVYEGANSSLWFAGVQVSGTIIVFILSIKVGAGRFLNRCDCGILGLAVIGLVLWYFTETAAYALAITISVSTLGGIATAVKAYRNPDSETLSTWLLSLTAACCAIVSVGKLDLIILAYPAYLFTLYLVFVVAIVLGRARRRWQDRSVPASAPSVIATFFAGLRVTADAVIVSAAGLFLVNWLSATATAPLNAATSLTETTTQQLAELPVGMQPLDRFTGSVVLDASVIDSLPHGVPGLVNPAVTDEPSDTIVPAIIVLAYFDENMQLRIMDRNELTERKMISALQQTLRYRESATDLLSSADSPPGSSAAVSDKTGLPSMVPVQSESGKVDRLIYDPGNDQILDRGDPFTVK